MTTKTVPPTGEMKACPFCQGDANAIEGGERWYVLCLNPKCACAFGESYDRDAMPDHLFYNEEEAIAAWSTRTPDSAVSLDRDDWLDRGFDVGMFSYHVKKKMQADGLTFRKAAVLIGVSSSTLNRVARGLEPDVHSFFKIARWLRSHPLAKADAILAMLPATPRASSQPVSDHSGIVEQDMREVVL